MSRYEDTCPQCGKTFMNSHVQALRFCSVGCQGRAYRESKLEHEVEQLRRLVVELADALHHCCYDTQYVPTGTDALIARARGAVGGS